MEQIWTFFQTLGKGIMQGINQFIDNDLQNYVPLFVIAAALILFVLLKKGIERFKNKKI